MEEERPVVAAAPQGQANQRLTKREKGWLSVCLAAVLCGVLGTGIITARSGANPLGLPLLAVLVFIYLYLPGRLLAKLLPREVQNAPYRTLLHLALGSGALVVLYAISARLGLRLLLTALPPVAVLVWGIILWRTGRLPVLHRPALGQLAKHQYALGYAALWGLFSLLFALVISLANAHPASVASGEVLPTQDLLWNIGNAKSFALGFPPQDIRFLGVRLTYHYLTELLWGIFSLVSGLDAYDIIAFYAGPLAIAALLLALRTLGRFFYEGSERKTALFVLLLFFGGSVATVANFGNGGYDVFGNTNFLHLVTNINSQATVLVFLSCFLVLFGTIAKAKFDVPLRTLLVTICVFVLVCFSKGPAAAIVTISFGIVMLLVLVFQKPHIGKALLLSAGVLGIFALAYIAVYSSGASNSMVFGLKTIQESAAFRLLEHLSDALHLSYFGLLIIGVVQYFFLQPLQLVLYFGTLAKDVRRVFWLPPVRLLAHGAVVGGIAAYYLFWHQSSSQAYFALISIFFLNLLAVDALPAFQKHAVTRWAVRVLAAVGCLTTVVLIVSIGMKAVAVNAQYAAPATQPAGWAATPADEQAMQWLRENTAQGSVFATNRTDSAPGKGDGISNLYTAYSGRQAFMEGYTYALTNMGISQQFLAARMQVNAALFSAGTDPQQVVQLCAQNGIAYLVFDADYPGDTTQLAALRQVYQAGTVTIYAV